MAQFRAPHGRLILFVSLLTSLSVGCSTSGNFVVPQGSQLEIYERPATVGSDGTVTMSPFFWTAVAGIPYRLTVNGETKTGKLRARFRVVSIFWPPFALIYWPVGFSPNLTYDLVNDTQQ